MFHAMLTTTTEIKSIYFFKINYGPSSKYVYLTGSKFKTALYNFLCGITNYSVYSQVIWYI